MAKKQTYKEAVEEIETILSEIENNELDVDNLSEKVKRISILLTLCKDKLYQTESAVEKILESME